jgi:PAS domain S-box-containing protein
MIRYAVIRARSHFLIVAILAMLGGAAYLAIDLNRSGREQVVRQYNSLQLLVAKEAAHEAVRYLRSGSGYLATLSRLESVQRGDSPEILKDLELHHSFPAAFQRAAISVVNTQGVAAFSTAGDMQGWDCSGCEFFQRARTGKNEGTVFISSWAREAAVPKGILPGSFLLAKPLYQSDWDATAHRSVETWSGVLLLTVNLQAFLKEHLAALGPTRGGDGIWIMDHDGTLLMQSEHPEMARQNVFRTGPQCAECHVSFDYARRMLGGGSGATEYQLKKQPKKLAAFVPMRVANDSWIMVVNAPYEEVTAFVGREYRKTLLLIGTVVLALSLASVVVYRANVSRLRAREEARQWRQKLELEEKIRRAEVRYRTLFEQSPDGILLVDPEALLPIEFNEAAHQQLGYSREEFARMRVCDHGARGNPEEAKAQIEKLLAEGSARFEIEQRTKEGMSRNVEVISETLKLEDRTVRLCIHHDITERKRAEAALAHRSAQLEALHEVSLGIAAETDTRALLRTITTETLKLFRGTTGGLLLYRHEQKALEWVVSLGGDPSLVGTCVKKGEGLAGKSWETGGPLVVCDYPRRNGQVVASGKLSYESAIVAPLRWGEDFLGVLQLCSDTRGFWSREDAALLGLIATQAAIALKNAALLERVRRDDSTKTTLLHDVNHRVKNNLARLLEIVRLEAERSAPTEPGCQGAFRDLENRLRGMEALHTMLTTSQWHPLPLRELVTQIVAGALSGSPIREQIRVSVLAPSDPLWVVPEQATAVALILSELTSNSVKHAFRHRREGRLEVRLCVEDGAASRPLVRLQYRDDGPGWPEPLLHGQNGHVGLRLMRASVRSPLRGELNLRNEEGAVAELVFRLALAN